MLLGLWVAKNDNQVRGVMVAGATALLIGAIWLTVYFVQQRNAGNHDAMLLTNSVMWFKPLNIAFSVGVDGISVVMILLSAIIVFTGTFASWQLEPMKKEYFLWFVLLSSGVFGFFISTDMFTMFMFYEVALIPMYLLIGVWGTGPKEYSAMKLTLMLMGGSALLVLGILGIYYFSGATTMDVTELARMHAMPKNIQNIFFPLVFIGFGVLGALFPFHTWSPDGHASAPTAVSMLHAGVLMKLGGYGCLRIAMFLMPDALEMWAPVFLVLTTISVVYGALSACVQTDLKYINAYLGGLMKVIPFLAVSYVVAGLANLGLPGFSGFVAEMTIFVGSFENAGMFHRVATIIACTAIVITAVYILRVVGKILFQKIPNKKFYELHDATWDERFAIGCLIFCVAGLGLCPLFFENMIMDAVHPIFEHIITYIPNLGNL